jgi:hypothetical protein
VRLSINAIYDEGKNNGGRTKQAAQYGLQRTEALPLKVCTASPEMSNKCEGVSPVPPLPLSHIVGEVIMVPRPCTSGRLD